MGYFKQIGNIIWHNVTKIALVAVENRVEGKNKKSMPWIG